MELVPSTLLTPHLTIADQAQLAMLKQIDAEHKGRAGATITTPDGRQVSAKLYISGQVGKWDVTGYGRIASAPGQQASVEAGVDVSTDLSRWFHRG